MTHGELERGVGAAADDTTSGGSGRGGGGLPLVPLSLPRGVAGNDNSAGLVGLCRMSSNARGPSAAARMSSN